MNNLLFRPIRVRSIIFTEACPLDCRYCNFKESTNFGTAHNLTKEELFNFVKKFDELDDYNSINTRILFSGGEPFLRWEWIKEIIQQYGNRFSYGFNTSGYLLTEEMIEFLSHYEVDWTLSIDGDEYLTNYLRPVTSNPFHNGYMKQLRKILPTFLYYYPRVPFRIIINHRYVDLLYKMYKFAEELNFPYFTFILDFNNRNFIRPNEKEKKYDPWLPEHTKILQEQLDLICQEILMGYIQEIKKPQIIALNNIISFLLNEIDFSPEIMRCQLFNERTLTTLYNNTLDSYCLKREFPDITILKQQVQQEYNSLNHQCIKDNNCDLFEFCCINNCIQNGYYQDGRFFNFDELECIVNKSCYNMALKLLTIANETCKDSFVYQQYIFEMMGGK